MIVIENQLKNIKSAYADIMSLQQRKRYQRCAALCKDFSRLQSQIGNFSCKSCAIIKTAKRQVYNLRRSVENSYKNQLSDYEAFLWKSQKIGQKNFPDCFRLIKIDAAEGKQYNKKKLNRIDFSVLSYKIPKLIQMATFILQSNQFLNKNVSEDVLAGLVKAISLEYNIVSYHNFSHAFSLQLQLYQSYQRVSEIQSLYPSYQIGIAYIAALAHDLNHSGTNSGYEIQKKTDLAMTYNYESVLQNMHAAQFHRIIRENPNFDIFSSIKNAVDREKAKRLVIKLILSTDVTKHFSNLGLFTERVQSTARKEDSPKSLDFKQSQDRIFSLEQLFHACDIGNPCVGFQNYMNWSTLLSYQFNKQAQIEQEQCLEVTEMLRYKGIKAFYSGQIGFINNLVLPQWRQLAILWPQLKEFEQNIQQNVKELKQRASKQ